jgi:membrane peptidoglycan carboxypeptidase
MRRIPSLKRYLATLGELLGDIRARSVYLYDVEHLTLFEEMVVVLEDGRFFRHRGVDLRSVLRELLKAMSFRRFGGASTIEMQCVRTLTGQYDRNISRKVSEMILSSLIGYHLSKRQILRTYLAHAYFGTRLNGARKASLAIFGKESADLNIEEAARLASMLVYPRPRVATDRWREKVERRADYGKRLWVGLHERLY